MQIPMSDWEVYKRGQPVRNKDAELHVQAQAEVVSGGCNLHLSNGQGARGHGLRLCMLSISQEKNG
jgi:hypothetical protein